MVAFMPEPHTLLIVVQPADSGRPAPSAAWRAGAWPTTGGRHAAHDHFLDLRGRDAGALPTADRDGAELRRGEAGQVALETTSGVRATETMTTGSDMELSCYGC